MMGILADNSIAIAVISGNQLKNQISFLYILLSKSISSSVKPNTSPILILVPSMIVNMGPYFLYRLEL